MKGKYEEVMDRIVVTEDMRSRILKNVRKKTEASKSKKKIIIFKNWKQYSSIAAVFAILVIGVFVYTNMNQTPDESQDLVASGPVEVGSLDELSKTVGFEVEGLKNLPFEVNEIGYIAYSDQSADVVYRSDDQQIRFSKTIGLSESNGYYETYTVEDYIELNGYSVILQGDESGYYIASWKLDDYSYTISSEKAQTEEIMKNLASEIIIK